MINAQELELYGDSLQWYRIGGVSICSKLLDFEGTWDDAHAIVAPLGYRMIQMQEFAQWLEAIVKGYDLNGAPLVKQLLHQGREWIDEKYQILDGPITVKRWGHRVAGDQVFPTQIRDHYIFDQKQRYIALDEVLSVPIDSISQDVWYTPPVHERVAGFYFDGERWHLNCGTHPKGACSVRPVKQ